MENETKETHITYSCGTHLLKVTSNVDYYPSATGHKEVNQEFYLAMYYYGIDSSKHGLWDRVKIAARFLWTGKMYSDQICLSQDEADRLVEFIEDNKIKII